MHTARTVSAAVEDGHEVGAWDWDLASGRLAWSPACRRIVGLEADAGCDYGAFLELVPVEDREPRAREIERALADGGAFCCEHRIRRPDGRLRWVCAQGRVVRDDTGRPLRVLGTLVDVTERVHESTQAVALRDRLLSVMSHDLRTPLTAIDLGGAVLLELADRSGNTLVRRQLEMIRRNAARLGGLIADLVDMASIEAGRLALMLQLAPLAPLIGDALKGIERAAQERGITVACENRLDECSRIDRERIVRALGALLVAALERTPRGGTVTVRATHIERELRVEVRDEAPGLQADEVRSLFELVAGPRRAIGRSVGTLYVARGIAEAHGGRIEVATDGRNVFTLAVPLERGDAP